MISLFLIELMLNVSEIPFQFLTNFKSYYKVSILKWLVSSLIQLIKRVPKKNLFLVELKLIWELDGNKYDCNACTYTRPFCLNHYAGMESSFHPLLVTENVWHMQVDSKFIVFNELQGNLICEDISICKFIHHSLRCVDNECLHYYTILRNFCITSAQQHNVVPRFSTQQSLQAHVRRNWCAHIRRSNHGLKTIFRIYGKAVVCIKRKH